MMTSEKEKLLYKTYEILTQMCWYDFPLERAGEFIVKDVMGFGTNVDEKMFNLEGYCKLIQSQRDQSSGMEYRLDIKPVIRRIVNEENVAVFVDEILFTMLIDGATNELALRLTIVLEFQIDRWMLIHWHGSVPVAAEGDTWLKDELKRKNDELQHKVDEQTSALKSSLENLKATQSQLIQSEKMASLGELTAGIAHEIQNPLNFVNNFSEVNKELIRDLRSEIQKGNKEEVNSIASDIEANEEKINHHGKRADSIVKNMLQHSRTSSGKKELTDINALCDEYLRLSYHGLRAKDKSFNAKFETQLDPTLPKVNVVPQDIGRVVLNLINNAFYAANEKLKAESGKKDSNYEPMVLVTTKSLGNKIETCVKDNGNGIPDSIKEKIFQPFFTTKPTGQGTGLGLSLSYDIVKAHGGELKVETRQGEGTQFIIQLPLDNHITGH